MDPCVDEEDDAVLCDEALEMKGHLKPRSIMIIFTLLISIILEYCVRHYNLWGYFWGWMDGVMHFMWGLNIFLLAIVLFKWKPLDALLVVFTWQMLWEAVEMIGDKVIVQNPDMLDWFFFDGVSDTLCDIAGGAVAWLILFCISGGFDGLKESVLREWMLFLLMAVVPLVIVGGILSIYDGASKNDLAIVWILAGMIGSGIVAIHRRIVRLGENG